MDIPELCFERADAEFVCPSLGYKEFLHADWLIQILSWQKPIGCWGDTRKSGRSWGNKRSRDRQMEEKPPADSAGNRNVSGVYRVWPQVNISSDGSPLDVDVGLEPPVFRTRQLLYEKVVSGNLSAAVNFVHTHIYLCHWC